MCKICDEYYADEKHVIIGEMNTMFGLSEVRHDVRISSGELYSCVYTPTDETFTEVSIAIKYCPFCGEKLK